MLRIALLISEVQKKNPIISFISKHFIQLTFPVFVH